MDNDYTQDQLNQDQPTATPKQQVIERIKDANNVLVTVKANPNVDELAATIGLTLMLNKLDKHATAVFSGEVPSILEFLKPQDTLETNTDSLRDFIVSLDKSKADKLRYKVEENVVKIYITPYRTSISEADLEFTQGDFNVDAVVALGVTKRDELDQAIMAHGRILHDATFITITCGGDFSDLGQINWQDQSASGLSEMLVSISEAFKTGIIDEQIATAFLTGIVYETERFSNPKTTPKVMTMSAQLMAAGANQQLIANELKAAVVIDSSHSESSQTDSNQSTDDQKDVMKSDGTLTVSHDRGESNDSNESMAELPIVDSSQLDIPRDSIDKELTRIESESESGTSGRDLLPQPASPDLDSQSYTSPLLDSDDTDPVMGSSISATAEVSQDQVALTTVNNDAGQSDATAILPPLNKVMTAESSQPRSDAGVLPPLSQDGEGIHIDTEGNMIRQAASQPKHMVLQPLGDEPAIGSPHIGDKPADNISLADIEKSIGVNKSEVEQASSQAVEQGSHKPAVSELDPIDPSTIPIEDNTTLADIEKNVASAHQGGTTDLPAGLDDARSAVNSALGDASGSNFDLPRADLNAMPLSSPPQSVSYDTYRLPDVDKPQNEVNDVTGNLADLESESANASVNTNTPDFAPPPVPPPMMPPDQAL